MKLTVRAKFFPTQGWLYIALDRLDQIHYSGHVDLISFVEQSKLEAAIVADIRTNHANESTDTNPLTFEIEVP